MYDIQEIQKILPQRYPFLMIDRILELETGKKVVAIKNVTINEGYFEGHFPEKPILPGALIIESMAQASIMLFYDKAKKLSHKQYTYYLGAARVRFRQPVLPGDQLKVTVIPRKVMSEMVIVEVKAEVADMLVAEGELSFAAKAEKNA